MNYVPQNIYSSPKPATYERDLIWKSGYDEVILGTLGLNPVTGVRHTVTNSHSERIHVNTEAEIGVIYPQAEECPGLLVTPVAGGEAWSRTVPSVFGGTAALHTP